MQYNIFRLSLEKKMKDACYDATYLLLLLESKTAGVPLEIIKGALLMRNRENALNQAIKELDKMYGVADSNLSYFVDQCINFETIKHGDYRTLQSFSFELKNCLNVASELPFKQQYTDNIPFLRSLSEKLPRQLRERWCERAVTIKEKVGYVTFEEFVTFVQHICSMH